MRAAWYETKGAAADVLQLGEMATPEAGPGEVRIKLHASGINPADMKLRSGASSYGFDFPRVIPHSDGAGVVDQVGEGVQPAWLGERVWLYNGQRRGRAFGTAAEYIALSADLVTPLADCASFAEGATLGIPAMTAYHGVFANGSVKGKTVLVTGGAGSVGFYAISLAAWDGARVLTTVSGPEKAARAKEGGADVAINYRKDDVGARVLEATNGDGVDLVVSVDFGGDLKWIPDAVRLNGAVTAYASDSDRTPTLPYHLLGRKNISIHPFILNSLDTDTLNRARWGVDRWVRDRPDAPRPVAGVYKLKDVVAAQETVESGAKFGTVVVDPTGENS